MSEADQLRLARTNLLAQLVDWSSKPPISYTLEGQSVNYADMIKNLKDSILAINELLLVFDPYEIRTVQDM